MKLLCLGAEGGACCLLLSSRSESISICSLNLGLFFGAVAGFGLLGDGLAVSIIRDEDD